VGEGGSYDLPSTAPCLTGGHALWVEGDPGCFWFVGSQLDSAGSSFFIEAEAYYATYDGALIEVSVPGAVAGWHINFNTWNAMGPMQTGAVYDALSVMSADSVAYDRTCPLAGGRFRVDEFSGSVPKPAIVGPLYSFTAAFAFTCAGSGVLRGCVHF
jgi:hypothetical protein